MATTDRKALDRLAAYMAQPGQWNGGDVCELTAELIVATGRPDPDGIRSQQEHRNYVAALDQRPADVPREALSPALAQLRTLLVATRDDGHPVQAAIAALDTLAEQLLGK